MPAAPTDSDTVRDLHPLGEYGWPSMPTEEAVHRAWARVKAVFEGTDDDPFIADDQLERTTLEMLDAVAAPPACGPVVDEIARAVAAWRSDSQAGHLKVIVTPPCDENGVVETFADQQGHTILSPPERQALLARPAAPVPDLGGDGLLVVPQLERWFVRHRNGLGAIRALLAAVYEQDRPVLIGCNSWAWAFLTKAVDINLLFPTPVTFQPFDADRLRDWFSDLSTASATQEIAFRLPGTGQDVFSTEGGAQGGHYFRTLAAHSLGVPWVAWHLWRRSLFSGRPNDSDDSADDTPEADDSGRTLYVGEFDQIILPGKRPQTALLVLHALLIHGPMTLDEIRAAVPLVAEPNIVPSLEATGFVEWVDGAVQCRAAAYPSVRAGLVDAGFPVDTL